MFGENIIPDDILDGFYDKKTLIDVSNNIFDLSYNLVDLSNNTLRIKKNSNNRNYGGNGRIRYIIRPIDKDGNMKKIWDDF